jgi:hypothetical protein
MAIKAYISDLTWRDKAYQKQLIGNKYASAAFYEDGDLSLILRSTARAGSSLIAVASFANVADNEKDFRLFVAACKKNGFSVDDVEKDFIWNPAAKTPVTALVHLWRTSRKSGAAKAGGIISAALKKIRSKEAVEIIKDRWPLPSKEWPTKVLLKEADVSLNTVKSILGKRPIAQYNYQAKLKRKANAKR